MNSPTAFRTCLASSASAIRLIHGYAVIDDDVVWNTVTTELPALRERLDELLGEG